VGTSVILSTLTKCSVGGLPVSNDKNISDKSILRGPCEKADVTKMVEGIWRDEVYEKNDKGEDVLVKTIGPIHNMITQPITNLLIGLLANEAGFSGGILYHAIGEGDVIWDTTAIPDPSKFDIQLLAELDRKSPDGITYLKYGKGLASGGSTTTILDPERTDPGSCVIGRFERDNFFTGMTITITAGTNVGEVRIVTSYTQATGEFIVDIPYPVAIDATSEYELTPISSATPTNVLEVRTTWDYGTPTDIFNFKYIREQGLFGGTATALPGTGFMLDRVTHDRVFKSPCTKLVRFIDLIFRV
jgi:hypothetical protein